MTMPSDRLSGLSRRECLQFAAVSMLGSTILGTACVRTVPAQDTVRAGKTAKPKSVAAIMTVYRPGSHADVLIGKILEGWKQDGGTGPALKLASMYVEQFPDADLARGMSRKYGIPLVESIADAITKRGSDIAVDGVISIGEHGEYPWNEKEQHLYPRRRFFEEITRTFEKAGRAAPVFSDKHLGPTWADAKWMYDRARELKIPFMAGSSLPLSFRSPEITVPMDCEIEAAVGIGYSGLDVYGSHALDCYQCIVERRRGGEKGVKWVQCLQGDAMWKAVDDGVVSKPLLDAALGVVPRIDNVELRRDDRAALFLFEYADGLLGAQFMLNSVGRTAVALQMKHEPAPLATSFEERTEPRYPHFAYLLKAIEKMMHTGRPSFPVERVFLTSGILDRALTSRVQGGKRLDTPELMMAYSPVDYPHAPKPDLMAPPVL